MKRKVFYSFHYDNDVCRVQQIRNMGSIEGNTPVTPNQWEEIKRGGDSSIKRWISKEMEHCSCLIVLIGEETSEREWVIYEIKHAVKNKKGVLGIYIHNLKDLNTQKGSNKGKNPFLKIFSESDLNLSNVITCFDPDENNPYNDIKNNLPDLVEKAIENREEQHRFYLNPQITNNTKGSPFQRLDKYLDNYSKESKCF